LRGALIASHNKTLHSNNIVLIILCALHRNEVQKLSSMYHIFPGYPSSIDIKRADCKFTNNLNYLCYDFTVFVFACLCVYFCNVLFLSVLQLFSVFLYVYAGYFFLYFYFCAASHGVIKNDN